ncbi:hypothetical protein N7G274_009297 [Stereocaulon virgatum]|uniref:Uncharacterized protein n=1 Tax=Stereocaulon virgatum TaxID=373712 RepID=A0ABR3ZWS0_9LECA
MPRTAWRGPLPYGLGLILRDDLTIDDFLVYIERRNPATGRLFPYDPNPQDRNKVSLTASWINEMTDDEYEAEKQFYLNQQRIEGRAVDDATFAASILAAVKLEGMNAQRRKYYHFCPGEPDHRGRHRPGIHAEGPCPYHQEMSLGTERHTGIVQSGHRSASRQASRQRNTIQGDRHASGAPSSHRSEVPQSRLQTKRAENSRLSDIPESNRRSAPPQRERSAPIKAPRRRTQSEIHDRDLPAEPSRELSLQPQREVGAIIPPPSPSLRGNSRRRPGGI